MLRFAVALSALSILASGCSSGGSSASTPPPPSSAGTSAPSCAESRLPTTVVYKTVPGVDPDLTSLDITTPQGACTAPVVMWVHGGGYRIGDKSNQVRDKVGLFRNRGWLFVSVNYRLTEPGRPGSAQYPDHYDDVAAAVAWVHANIANYGGDPLRVALLGHSAGADIVANVTANPAYLDHQGLDLNAVRCAGPLDTEGFDKVAAGARGSEVQAQQWKVALGNNPDYVTETSATLFIRSGIGIPPTIGVYRGTARRQQTEIEFLDALDAAGIPTTRIDARSLTHSQVNTRIGAVGDRVMTPPLVNFLTRCFVSRGAS